MPGEAPERYPTARDIERIARNPECVRLRAALAAKVDLRRYAAEMGIDEGRQSPIAIARGEQAEAVILGKEAGRLVERFMEDGRLEAPVRVRDLGRRRAPNRAGLAKAADATDREIAAVASGRECSMILVHPPLAPPPLRVPAR